MGYNTADDDDNDEQDLDTSLLLQENLHEGHHRSRNPRVAREGRSSSETFRTRDPGVRGGGGEGEGEGVTSGGRGRGREGVPGVDEAGQEMGTPAYPERLHRGHNEKIKVWEKRYDGGSVEVQCWRDMSTVTARKRRRAVGLDVLDGAQTALIRKRI